MGAKGAEIEVEGSCIEGVEEESNEEVCVRCFEGEEGVPCIWVEVNAAESSDWADAFDDSCL